MSYINWFDYKGTKSKTNIFFSNRQILNLNPQEEIDELNLAWFDFLSKDSTNGKLLIKNTYKKDFQSPNLYFIHVTPSFNEIIKSKKIFPSGGGLGAVIYGSLLHRNNKIHNLTEMYLKFQFPKKIKSKVGLFCIKLKIPKELLLQSKNWGVDYTLFGNIHCQTWRKIKKIGLIRNQYSLKLEKKITKDIAKTFKILNIFLEYNLKNLTFKRFKKYYNKLFNTIPSLRFIIYESLAEYILFYQNNKSAKFYNTKNEIYNQNHKQFIWDLCPWMLKKFDISKFFIELDKIISYFYNSNIIRNFDQNHFENFIKWRIAFYIKKITINKINPKKLNFDYLIKNYPSLIGQILYRSFYNKSLFEEIRSKFLYENWFNEKIICPIYQIVPKGEVGINPNLKDFGVSYVIFKADIDWNTKKIKLGKKVDIKICNNLIDKNKCSVR